MFTQIVKIECKDNLHHLKVTKLPIKDMYPIISSSYSYAMYYMETETHITPHRHVLALLI